MSPPPKILFVNDATLLLEYITQKMRLLWYDSREDWRRYKAPCRKHETDRFKVYCVREQNGISVPKSTAWSTHGLTSECQRNTWALFPPLLSTLLSLRIEPIWIVYKHPTCCIITLTHTWPFLLMKPKWVEARMNVMGFKNCHSQHLKWSENLCYVVALSDIRTTHFKYQGK